MPGGYLINKGHETVSLLKVICDLRSVFTILSNWNNWNDTGAMLYQLSYEATHWEQGQL